MQMCKRSAAVVAALVATGLLSHGTPATAQEAAPASARSIKVLAPDARGLASWGTDDMSRAIQRELRAELGAVFDEKDLRREARALGIAPKDLLTPTQLARVAKKLGAQYVLLTVVTKKGWLYTARAVLVDAADASIGMDFRSDYYKPKSEARDRGVRVARKAIYKLGVLLESRPTAGAGSGGEAVAGDTGAGAAADTAGDGTASAGDGAGAEASGDTGGEVAGEASGDAGSDSGGEVAGEASAGDASSSGDEYGGDDFAAEFAAEFAADPAATEYDGFVDEGGWSWQVRGWIGTKYFGFFSDEVPDYKNRNFVKTGIKSTLTGKLGSSARVRVQPLVEVDLVNQRLHRVLVEEGFFEYSFESVEFRVGWDSLTWGSASTVHVVDIINARDFTEGVTDAPKVGQPMLSTKFLFGNHSLTLLYMSPFTRPNLPRFDMPFSTLAPPPDVDPATYDIGSRVLYASELDEWHPQAAARLALSFNKFDWRASYFYGYGRFPLVHLPTDTTVYPLLQHISTDFAVLLGGWSLKAEVAYAQWFETERTRNPPITLRNGLKAQSIPLPDPRVTYVLGVEKTFDTVFGDTQLTPVVELIGDSDSGWFTDDRPPDDLNRFFENHLAWGFRWALNNDVDSRISFGDIMDLRNPGDHLFTLEYEERWYQHFTFVLGGRLGVAEDGNKGSGFRQLTGVYSELRLNY